MPKHFDLVNYGKQACHDVTIYGNVITLSGGSGTANVTINGFLNTAIASFSADLATTAIAWVAANYDYYYTRGIVVASTGSTGSTGLITATPRYGYTSINSINASIATVATLGGTVTGKCEVDFAKGRIWRITFGQNITMLAPKNAKDGEAIRLELKATGAYSVTWTAGAWYFPGGTEPTQTSTATDVQSGVFQLAFARRYDTLTLSGSTTDGHSGTIAMPGTGLSHTVTVSGTSLTTTATAFVSANAAAYLLQGVVLTSSGATLIFTASSNASDYYGQPQFTNVTGTLAGANVQTPAGRVLMNSPTATQQIIQ
jgi:hypothetical protein